MEQPSIENSLVKEGLISQEQLATLKLEQQRSSVSLIKAIRRRNFIPEDSLINFLTKNLHLTFFSLVNFTPPPDLQPLLPAEFLWKEKVIPLFREGEELGVGMAL